MSLAIHPNLNNDTNSTVHMRTPLTNTLQEQLSFPHPKKVKLDLTAALVHKSSFQSNSVLTDLQSTKNWMHSICCMRKSALHYKWVQQAWTIATWVGIVNQEYSEHHKCICMNIHWASRSNFLLEVSHLMSGCQTRKSCVHKFKWVTCRASLVLGDWCPPLTEQTQNICYQLSNSKQPTAIRAQQIHWEFVSFRLRNHSVLTFQRLGGSQVQRTRFLFMQTGCHYR